MITDRSVFDTLRRAEHYCANRVKECCLDYIAENMDRIRYIEDWRQYCSPGSLNSSTELLADLNDRLASELIAAYNEVDKEKIDTQQ